MCHHFGKVGPFNQIHKQSATIKCGKPMYRPYSLNTVYSPQGSKESAPPADA